MEQKRLYRSRENRHDMRGMRRHSRLFQRRPDADSSGTCVISLYWFRNPGLFYSGYYNSGPTKNILIFKEGEASVQGAFSAYKEGGRGCQYIPSKRCQYLLKNERGIVLWLERRINRSSWMN